MEWVLDDRSGVVNSALPAEFTGTTPSTVMGPSMNTTLPVGTPDAGATAVTVAVNVTA